MVLETYKGYHLDVFSQKQNLFFQSKTKALFPHTLVFFSKLNDFTIDFFKNKVVLVILSQIELAFSRNSAIPRFGFDSIA